MRRDLLLVAGDQLGQPVHPRHADRALPGQVVEPDVVERHGLRLDAEQRGEVALQPDRHIAQPDRAVPRVEQRPGDDADRVGEVDQPRAGRRPPPGELGDLKHERHGAQRLGQPARPGRLLSHAAEFKRPRLVPVPRRLAADPELYEHRARAINPVLRVGSPPHDRPVPVRPHDPRGHGPDRGQPRLVGVDQDHLGDLWREPPEPVCELRRVGGAAADNSKFHENAFTSAPVWATWHAVSPPPSGSSSGVTVRQRSVATGQRGWNRQPGRGSITLGGSPRSPAAAASASRLGGGALGSGTAESSSWVYGCRGAASTSSTGPVSAIRPAYITISRSATYLALAMSWVM